jgi:5'-methylthioadenosine nucleosidase
MPCLQGAAIGDIFLSSSTINHDRRIPIPGFDKYGIGQCHSNPSPLMQSELGFKLGVISSGNSLDYTDKCLEIMGNHDVRGS